MKSFLAAILAATTLGYVRRGYAPVRDLPYNRGYYPARQGKALVRQASPYQIQVVSYEPVVAK